MKIYKILAVLLLACVQTACDFLDVVPDNLATLDIAFNNKASAEKYLATCYSYVPTYGGQYENPGLAAGTETWYYSAHDPTGGWSNRWTHYIARGFQNTQSPLANYWDGDNGGKGLFKALRDCNIFLEYVEDRSRVSGLSERERLRWLAEVKTLKAFYHYYLLRLYGPIPIIDENLPVTATPEEVKVKREKVDDVVKYIVDLLDEAVNDLPPRITLNIVEDGRLTQAAALGIKAETLLLAASPLFNGNADYANFVNQDKEPFINQTYDRNKWKLAADAAKAAIDNAETNGVKLYNIKTDIATELPDELLYGLHVRGAVTERFNSELVWSVGKQNTYDLQRWSMARLSPTMDNVPENMLYGAAGSVYAPTLTTVERFYSKNGVPIEEDKEWIDNGWYNNRYNTQSITSADRYNMKEGERTAILNFNREPRFYGSIGFDRGTWFGSGWVLPENDPHYIKGRSGELGGIRKTGVRSITGYYAKKINHLENVVSRDRTHLEEYPFPILRLADLYLMYAEALNEAEDVVNEDVYKYINLVRNRSGIPGVKEAWKDHSIHPSKPSTAEGMREIIRRERLIELAIEGHHYFDVRRWKTASKELSQPVLGWNIEGEDEATYYQIRTIYIPPVFTNKQYLWPLKEESIIKNSNLIQTYGW
ncbi:RagB/SusD family nutrient uptake outer membrane protein [Bacteroides sp. 51]|uniref:RagB/SusD family nutrient uptake outer membrane protein n=1 Tax=Bacteroides sp. 51 TaxID=2302938 RepID=UPI0013D589EB|nr:RagB/SusD family nutrient uptake outer membrane protein [Bacteroides sp. 51]NDV80995.1 RagB/SusD family nutrient uptake outer membrane protein [Bacteroides sp. 51]